MRAALLVAALAGCNSILGVGDFTAGGGDDVVDPNSVTGTSELSYVVYDGTIQKAPEDLSKYVIKAYLPDGTGNFTVAEGTGKADGTFEIPNVPMGMTYYLYLLYPQIPNHPPQTPRIFVTSARTVDLGYYVPGRSDGVEATRTSTVSFDLTAVSPWAPRDILLIDSYNNGSEFSDISLATNTPAIGATSISGYTFDWRDGYTYHPVGSLPRLVDAAKGDDLTITHLHNVDVNEGTWAYSVGIEAGVLKKTDVTQIDGSPLMVTGALTPTTLDKVQALNINLDKFRMQFKADGGRIGIEQLSVGRLDNSAAQYQSKIGSGPWNVTIPTAKQSSGVLPTLINLSNITYGESAEVPATWGHLIYGRYVRQRRLRAPSATGAGIGEFSEFLRPAASPFDADPAIRPVTKIEVDSKDTLGNTGAIAYDGTKGPTVSWDSVAQVDGYTVTLWHVYADGGVTQREAVFAAGTASTSFVIPPAFVTQGQRYAITITTFVGADDAGPRRFRVPGGSARIVGNSFLYSASCGDGVVQTNLGEECDEMGDTVNCDADCSFALCGDLTTNAALSEACDGGTNESMGCDSDCTLPTCGDGIWNALAEYCDDGNADDTDGCTTTCQRSGSCGDGTIQPSVEDCEPPNAGSCGADCRTM